MWSAIKPTSDDPDINIKNHIPNESVYVDETKFTLAIRNLIDNAIKYNNCEPVFMDVNNDYNIDSEKTIEFIKQNTTYNWQI